MRGKPIAKKEIEKIIALRQTGHSLPEICRELKRRNSTVHRFIKNVVVLPEYINLLKQKQGGSINRSKKLWKESELKAIKLLGKIKKRDKFFILAAIYWGEGTKKELSLINSDPALIRVFLSCLEEIGINKKDLRVSLRIYENIKIDEAKKYWASICGIRMENILNVNILKGKKLGKLPYGMCRIRISKSGPYFKLIMSMIKIIKSKI